MGFIIDNNNGDNLKIYNFAKCIYKARFKDYMTLKISFKALGRQKLQLSFWVLFTSLKAEQFDRKF